MTQQELDAIRERLAAFLNDEDTPSQETSYVFRAPSDVAALLAHADRFAALTPDVIEVMQEALLQHRAKYGDVHRKLCDKGIVFLESLKEKP